jgi:hypothetical protein
VPARKFLYVVAVLIVLTLGSALTYRFWGQKMLTSVMVPSARFAAPKPLTEADYDQRRSWLARPDISSGNALWRPAGVAVRPAGPVAIFYVHPTSYMASFNVARWNAPLRDTEADEMAQRFVRTQASAFNAVGSIWAPRYHQAHFGAFLSESGNGRKAIDAAYQDVRAAFAAFRKANPAGPIILAGHSQGSLHLMRLMKDEIADKPIAQRIVAAYLVGWPISLTADLPALGLPACSGAEQPGCLLSWQSFAEPADPSAILDAYRASHGLTGKARKDTPMLCINPLTGTPDSRAPEKANLGTLAPAVGEPTELQLVKAAVGARCHDGFLLIGAPPQLGPFVLPGNNYHVYDYALFWANIRHDAERRLATFLKQQH